MTIEEILQTGGTIQQIIQALQEKAILIPSWGGPNGLLKQYDPKYHPVMNKAKYPDVMRDGKREEVTRITLEFQRLAVKRMTELCTGIPVKRVYYPQTERHKELQQYIENVLTRNRIDSVNNERLNMLFAGCEVLTLWYAVEQPNNIYGFDSPLKLRCKNYTPMVGDELYPLFDEYGDMIAMSVGYTRKVGRNKVQYFDCYTDTQHIKWSTESGQWAEVENEQITLGKIPAIYMWRPDPIWGNQSNSVYEMEWTLSRNGNYIRRNGKPLFTVFSDEPVKFNNEKSQDQEFRSIMLLPKGGSAQYVTWPQAIDNMKFQIDTLRNLFFTQLQLPDWSYEKMSQVAMSGESRKQLFIDAQLKVKDESGRLIEFFDREVNVVKAFLKVMLPESDAAELDSLEVEQVITPFTITDEKDQTENLLSANGGKPLISHRESIELYGYSKDVDQTLKDIQADEERSVFEPHM